MSKQKRSLEMFNKLVDDMLLLTFGCTQEMLPDFDTYKAWKDGRTPIQTARSIVAAAKRF